MTRNKKIVIPNITYVGQQQNNSSGQISPIIKQTNLEVAKRALSRLNNPKLSNLEKAKKALKESNNPLYYPKLMLILKKMLKKLK
jgi:hypothetical protein